MHPKMPGFKKPFFRPWLVACFLGVLMSTQNACSEDRIVFHGFSYDPAVDSPDIELLDCLYGETLGTHTAHEVQTGKARRGECFNGAGKILLGDSLYVKWRDKNTQKVYEDRVDLRSRLPSPKEMHKQEIYFLIDNNQLYVYLIPDRDWDTKRNHLPPGKQPNGPGSTYYLDVKTLYPDNAPPKIRGGNMPAEWYEQRIREMHKAVAAKP